MHPNGYNCVFDAFDKCVKERKLDAGSSLFVTYMIKPIRTCRVTHTNVLEKKTTKA